MRKMVLASNNKKKMKEMRELLAPMGVEVIAQGDLGIGAADEPWHTFVENSLTKTRHASLLSGLPAIADDSGICVDALGGAPGVFSARYSGAEATDEKNNEKLIKELAGLTNRRAYYVCVLTAMRDPEDPTPLIAQGIWSGEIALEAAGDGGFGYDPWFIPDGNEGLTAAQMSAEAKNAVSHRGQAMRIMQQLIAERWRW